MEPWHWETPQNEYFNIQGQIGPVVVKVPVYRVALQDNTTPASNRLVLNGNTIYKDKRQSKTYNFITRLIGIDQYTNLRRKIHNLRNISTIITWPKEYWKHPDGRITVKKKQSLGGISSVSYEEAATDRWTSNMTVQITKEKEIG